MGYWIVQCIVVYVLTFLWFGVMALDDSMYPNPLRDDSVQMLREIDYHFFMWMVIGVITVAQAIYLLPMRRPGVVGPRGRSARLSLVVAGAMIGLMMLGALLAIYELIPSNSEQMSEQVEMSPIFYWAVELTIIAVCWIVPTALLFALVSRGKREAVLGRLATRILAGTMAEVVLLIPIDVMIRRRTECYCGEGSFFALTAAMWVGIFAAGPAAVVPLIAKGRRGWYRTHCAACGYDMSGAPEVDCCPECGTGWVAGRGSVIPGSSTKGG